MSKISNWQLASRYGLMLALAANIYAMIANIRSDSPVMVALSAFFAGVCFATLAAQRFIDYWVRRAQTADKIAQAIGQEKANEIAAAVAGHIVDQLRGEMDVTIEGPHPMRH